MRVMVYADPAALAEGASEQIARLLREAPGPRVSLGLAGGSTPTATYRQLRGLPAQWGRVDAWLADERWVPKDTADNNGHMVAETLLNHVDAHFSRPRWAPWLEPVDAAAHYEADLRSIHDDRRPDLILLGVGTDGHTASLFPQSDALAPTRRWYVSTLEPAGAPRLSATLTLLHRARRLIMLVAGEAKAQVVAQVLEEEADLPARRVLDGESEVTWLLDQAAASQLRSIEIQPG
jgi:6-phosphogluconolactonase